MSTKYDYLDMKHTLWDVGDLGKPGMPSGHCTAAPSPRIPNILGFMDFPTCLTHVFNYHSTV